MNIVLVILGALILLTFAWGSLSAAPWLPTKKAQRQELVKTVPLKTGETVYDLGCGDGSVLFALVRANPGIKAVGLEISLLPFLIAWTRKLARPRKYKNVSLKYKNFFWEDLSRADVVFIFLLSKCYNRLISKFYHELKDDCLVVVEAWSLPEFNENKTIKKEGLLPVYFYKGKQFRAW